MVLTRGGKATSNEPTPTTSPAKSSPAKSSPSNAKKLPVRPKDDGEDETKTEEVKQAPAKTNGSNMVVFGDDDDEVDAQITKAKAKAASASRKEKETEKEEEEEEEEEEEDEDSDEAPEAVSTSQAASAAKQSLKASQKAAQEKLATQKRKRQERDTLLKQQAAERKKTQADAEQDEPAAKPAPAGRARGEKIDLPNVLPAEFLTDSSSEDEDDDAAPAPSAGSKSKRRKVAAVENSLARLDRGPRDVAMGSTVYRVASNVDQRLAPKAKKHAKGSKAALLQRNRPAVKSRTSGSFFTRK